MRKDPDAMKAVDYAGAHESHPVCKAMLAELGPGRKGSDLRSRFTGPPYGWSQDAVDGALIVLANAGLVRVTGDDGKPASLPDLPRQKLGKCTFRGEDNDHPRLRSACRCVDCSPTRASPSRITRNIWC